MIKKTLRIATVLLAAVMLTACGSTDSRTAADTGAESDSGTVMAAEYSGQGLDFSTMFGIQYVQDRLYYTTSQIKPDSQEMITTIYCMEEPETAQKLLSFDEGQELRGYKADSEGGLYLFLKEGDTCFLQKVDSGQTEVYRTEEGGQIWEKELVYNVAISCMGETCVVTGEGTFLIWDSRGKLVASMKADWYGEDMSAADFGLVSAGESGVFAWHFMGGRLSMQKIDTESGRLEAETQLAMPDMEQDPGIRNWCDLYSGYGNGIYLAGDKKLWRWDTSSKEPEELFGWGDPYVNIQRDSLRLAAGCQDGSIMLFTYDWFQGISEQVKVAARDVSDLPERQEITIGSMKYYDYDFGYSDDVIAEFNRRQEKYTLVKQVYKTDEELHLALIQGKAADILCLSGMTVENLAALGVLEDLTGYLASSEQIHEEDLLPAVLEGCTMSGGIRFLYNEFGIRVMLMEKGHSTNGGITTEDFLKLTEGHQDAYLLNFGEMMSYDIVLRVILLSDMSSFVDWDNRTCSFDSEEFIWILQRIASLKVPVSGLLGEERWEYYINEMNQPERLRNREFMVYVFDLFCMKQYMDIEEAFGEFADVVGYPTQSGEPRYLMLSEGALGINSASDRKEGAWAFIEYIILNGVDEKDPYAKFSVLKEKFERQLYPEDEDGKYQNIFFNEPVHTGLTPPTEEQADRMRYIVDHAVWRDSAAYRDIQMIIREEAPYFFAGDKSAEAVADVIQRRISIMLAEE
ncbi:MAG: hypothetical protein K2K63_10630 [Acetatifactor sp.]|nr:hypothetical protein [Acetatifactor sp.]